MTTTAMRRTTKIGVWVGSVPEVIGTVFFEASEPATASTGIMIQKRPKNMHSPSAAL